MTPQKRGEARPVFSMDELVDRDTWHASVLQHAREMLQKWRLGYTPDADDLADMEHINDGYPGLPK